MIKLKIILNKILSEKSLSDKQRKFFNVVLSYKNNKTKNVSDNIKKIAKSMTKEDIKDFAFTKGKLQKKNK